MVPTAGGGYGFARTAFGPLGGFLTGTAILIEYAIAPAAIAVFIGAYCESLFGIGGWMIYLAFYIVFIGIHIFGVGEALKLMFIITAVAALARRCSSSPWCRTSRWTSCSISRRPPLPVPATSRPTATSASGRRFPTRSGSSSPSGVPLAAEETKNPQRDMPRGLIGAMLILVAFAGLILLVGPGGAGSSTPVASGNPLVEALTTAYGSSTDERLRQLSARPG